MSFIANKLKIYGALTLAGLGALLSASHIHAQS